ncbi:MAG: TetR family transcriptional regulator [Bacteroides sp.]|jgi:AcrR family transcriptional regulator|nr:TetR family transcriptional regulator [Bacteroides sp.]
MAKSRNTEQKIFEAATELFLEKGVDRTSVRDIANKAGINLALMNYYFRSKENLFDAIFSMLVKKNTRKMIKIMDSELELEEKIRKYVEAYIDMLIENPLLVSFVMSIVHRSQERITQMNAITSLYSSPRFAKQIFDESAKGNIIPTNPTQLFIDMLSLITFPFAIKALIKDKTGFGEAEYRAFLEERKKRIPDMLMAYLKPVKS